MYVNVEEEKQLRVIYLGEEDIQYYSWNTVQPDNTTIEYTNMR